MAVMLRASSIFPITPLVRKVQNLAMELFEISEQNALDYAAEQVALAEAWGSPETAGQFDWPYHIKKDLGESRKLKWKREQEREEFESAQKQKYAALDALIAHPPRRPFGC